MIISRTPFRISFFGGGTDYPVWYRQNGGAVLATTVDKYCYISCRYLPPFFDHKSRVVYSKIENVKEVAEIQHPAVRAILQEYGFHDGIEIHHDGDLPARTGLGSSSSFTVGLLHCLYALRQKMPSKSQLAKEAIRIERDVLKENVGSQDQVSASFGGLNHITFSSNDEINVRPVIIESQRLKSFQDHLMLFFTGFSRFASNIAKEQVQNTHKKQTELSSMFDMVQAAIDILSSKEDIGVIGKLLHESWMLKRSLTTKITNHHMDEIYEAAQSAGALGGKLLGAGGGGFMLLFVRPEDQAKVRERLNHLIHVPFEFEKNGTQIVFYDQDTSERDLKLINACSRVDSAEEPQELV